MSEICNHPKSLNLPTQYSKIYKDECTLCFDSQDSDCGINVCLTCFNGSCISNSHTNLHFNKTNHPLVVNIKRIKKVRDPGTPPPQKLTKIEIKAENEADLYEFVTKPICLPCGNVEINRSEGNINAVIESVLNSLSAKKQSEIKAWEEDITSCKHTKEVVQEENVQLSNHAQAHCVNCELKENLWLCLTCGNLACGRQQYGIIVFDILLTKVGGMGGNGHGLQHFEQAGHSVAVKLGTITPEGQADVFCYSCGEERLDPLLGQHLGNIGIKIADQQKTEKTLTELQVEQNLKFDFSMATEDGKTFTPLFGSGLTGLKNLGNTCYMASVLQTLFSISKFQDRYINLSKSHHEHCGSIPAECFHCQICKLADGLLSGRYSSREKQVTTTEEGKEVIIQQGISPSMFKNLIGKGHPEFSTMKQQDSQDYLTHLLSIIEQKENNNIANPTKIFNVSFEQKLQCLECLNVKYTSSAETGILHLFMNTKNNDEKESIKFEDCLDDYFSESRSEGWNCPRDKKPTTCVK
ncbi:hypothetical protein HK099_003821 [Clydaea vesicula]|uniref:Ubiquitinyl hydrolase 1 n=1 Tax=Clydaea vesicula TaxID=447962 RepID=A0AAD5XW07_9FUNG|nr:hypothetical protein HK099_003821 [Clydaea vesicula]